MEEREVSSRRGQQKPNNILCINNLQPLMGGGGEVSMELHGGSSGIILYSVAVIPVRRLKNLHSELSETNSNSLAIIFSDLLV